MAMMKGPYIKKPKDQLIRRNKAPELIVLDGISIKIPEPPEEWTRCVVDEWYDFWDSPLSTLVNRDSDMGALQRLFRYKHEFYMALEEFGLKRVDLGHRNEERVNPYFKVIQGLEKMILPLEDRFGMSPAGRLRIGATLGEASKSLNEMNAAIDQEVDGDDDNTDPRDVLDTTASH